MSIAFDASSVSSATDTGDFNWTHTPVGTPRGVLVLVIQEANGTDQVIGVTYGGVAMSETSDSPYLWTASIDDAAFYCYFLGSSVPTGAQTVAVDVNATGSVKKAVAITVTAANDTIVEDTGTTGTSNGSNPSVPFTTTHETIVLGGMHTGNAVLSAVSAGSGFTEIAEVDWGPNVSAWARSTSVESAGSFSRGWTSTGGTSQAALGVAVAEVVALVEPVTQVTETDLAQPVAWAPKHRLIAQALETDAGFATIPLGENAVPVFQALETEAAQPVTFTKSVTANQALETDVAQAVTALRNTGVGQAQETDLAQPIRPPLVMAQVAERDRARQVTVVGGVRVISDTPVLIRAPRKAGRIFHEIEYRGDTYHPNIAAFQAEEEAPGGFGSATGRVSERIYRAHRDVFRPGSQWLVYHEDGTCLHQGRLLQPDTSDGEVQLTDRGAASLAEREVGPILYQRILGDEAMVFGGHPRWWSVRTDLGHQSAAMLVFERQDSDPDADDGAWAIIPFFGRELAHMRFQIRGSRTNAYISVFVGRKGNTLRVERPGDINLLDLDQVWTANIPVDGWLEQIQLDLTLLEDDPLPQNPTDNYDNPDIVSVYPDCVAINVGDYATASTAKSVELVDIEINGAALGRRRHFSAHDLVADIAALIGIRYTAIEGGSFGILPYELPPGTPASEPLDWASLLTGKRSRIRHNGNRAVLEFGSYDEHTWGLASPWAPFDAIPQERYDAVSVPFYYGGSQLDDQVIAKLEDSPLDRRNIFWGLTLSDPAHNRDKAQDLGALIAEEMVRKRNAGSFAAAEVIGPDGEPTTAHHVNAGDTLYPMRPYEPGRLRISHLTRFDDHVEGTFDGGNHALDRMLARREKKMSRR